MGHRGFLGGLLLREAGGIDGDADGKGRRGNATGQLNHRFSFHQPQGEDDRGSYEAEEKPMGWIRVVIDEVFDEAATGQDGEQRAAKQLGQEAQVVSIPQGPQASLSFPAPGETSGFFQGGGGEAVQRPDQAFVDSEDDGHCPAADSGDDHGESEDRAFDDVEDGVEQGWSLE